MGRGRAPCCEKIGLNKGSWTPEEDMRLVSYIHKYGHSSWRALPKQAGLLRCGKSCRLRWINYLRPDVKRGNFSKEEEDDIIRLHASLGNKWSKIASLLPGRTDNEIKNVWNTHLKKRLQKPKDGEAEEKRKYSEEQLPSSPSSLLSAITAPASCSEQVESRTESEGTDANLVANKVASGADVEESIDKIEIPIEPNMGLWEMLDDDDDHYFPKPSNCLSSCSSSSNMVILKDPMEEIWSMIEDEIGVGPDACNDQNRAAPDDESSESTWLAYLEKELELWDNNDVNDQESTAKVEGGDPVTSYFQRPPSPSVVPPLDDLLY